MQLPERTFQGAYRYGFNGMEQDSELKGNGNSYDFGARIYDPRVGRWGSVDPIVKGYIGSYQFSKNCPSNYVDPDGKDEIHFYYTTREVWTDNGILTEVRFSASIIPNGDDSHTFYIHNSNIGSSSKAVQIFPFRDDTNLPYEGSYVATEHGLPLSGYTNYFFGLLDFPINDHIVLGRILQATPGVIEYYQDNDHRWAWALSSAATSAGSYEFGEDMLYYSEWAYTIIDGYILLRSVGKAAVKQVLRKSSSNVTKTSTKNVIKTEQAFKSVGSKGKQSFNPKDFKSVDETFLRNNGIEDVHEFKAEFLGTNQNLSKFDVVKHTSTNELLIVRKSSQEVVERTYFYVE